MVLDADDRLTATLGVALAELTGTKRDRVKQLGNSVPPLLAAHVIGSVARAL